MDISSNQNVIIPKPDIIPSQSDITLPQTKYMKYRFNKRLHYWRYHQTELIKSIARIKKALAVLKGKTEKYQLRLWEYEAYVINHSIPSTSSVLDETATRLGQRLEALQEDGSDDEEDDMDDMSDMQSVSTCDTDLAEMREALRGRR